VIVPTNSSLLVQMFYYTSHSFRCSEFIKIAQKNVNIAI